MDRDPDFNPVVDFTARRRAQRFSYMAEIARWMRGGGPCPIPEDRPRTAPVEVIVFPGVWDRLHRQYEGGLDASPLADQMPDGAA